MLPPAEHDPSNLHVNQINQRNYKKRNNRMRNDGGMNAALLGYKSDPHGNHRQSVPDIKGRTGSGVGQDRIHDTCLLSQERFHHIVGIVSVKARHHHRHHHLKQ